MDFPRHFLLALIVLPRLLVSGSEPELSSPNAAEESSLPNIVILYADDLGYGDLRSYNPDSKIPTPQLDRLATESLRLMDAHSSSGICTPSRYALLTGRLHWRDGIHEIDSGFDPPFLKEEQLTLAEMLREAGYDTACIGKWHLGHDWDSLRNPFIPPFSIEHDDFDWTQPLRGGAVDHGFDYYFGDSVINLPPFTWIENDRILIPPDTTLRGMGGTEPKEGRWDLRPGPAVSGWDFYEVLPTLTEKAVDYIHLRADESRPFFLYFALSSPHTPIIPNDEFDGTSDAGAYGDFVVQTDEACGRVIAALRETGLYENTIVIFTADNGPEVYAYARDLDKDHWSSAPLRGIKRDLYEGGHRVPTILRWPGVTEAGETSEALFSQVDLMATLADFLDYDLPTDAAADSYNFWPYLQGDAEAPPRNTLVHNTWRGRYAIRHGDWLLVDYPTGTDRQPPEAWMKKHDIPPYEGHEVGLYNLAEDLGQRHNLAAEHPERVRKLQALLESIRAGDATAPRLHPTKNL